jgi:hypothetical protein
MTNLDTLGIAGAVIGALGALTSLGIAFFRNWHQGSSFESSQRPFDVVLSFASVDAPLAEKLAKDLQTHHLKVWPEKPEEGMNVSELEANVAHSRYGVVIVSKATLDAGPSAEELKPFSSSQDRPRLLEVLLDVSDDELRNTVAARLAPQLTLRADELTVKEMAGAISAIVATEPQA